MTVLMMMAEEWRWCGTSQHRNSMVWVVPGGRKMTILIPPTIHVDKKRSSSVFRGWSENEGKCCHVGGLKRRSPHNMERVVWLDPLSQSCGLPCGWQGVKVPRKHGGHLCRQKISMLWLWIQISLQALSRIEDRISMGVVQCPWELLPCLIKNWNNEPESREWGKTSKASGKWRRRCQERRS